MTSSSTMTPRSDLTPEQQLQVIEVKPGFKAGLGVLTEMLPTAEDVLFFGKVFDLDYQQLSQLMSVVLHSDVAAALFNEGGYHSNELQSYIVDTCEAYFTDHQLGELVFAPNVPHGEILPEVWKSLELEVATSIKDVAAKLATVVGLMPGKQGQMLFQSMMKMNARRPTIGTHQAFIHHRPEKQNLVILDVSGSMSAGTIRTIVDDVVAMSYLANAHLAIVSNTCTYWEPGTYDSNSILDAAEFGGTHYEQLSSVLNMDWGTVVTIADYDSSWSAKRAIAHCIGSIDMLLDMSLVDQPTFLAECVGQLAAKVRPLLVGNTPYVLQD